MIDNRKLSMTITKAPVNKISVIKAIRQLTGMGLKDAKDASEFFNMVQIYDISPTIYTSFADPNRFIEEQAQILRNEGIEVGESVHKLLNELRVLGSQALQQGEDELANEILQLVLTEKLRRKPDGHP